MEMVNKTTVKDLSLEFSLQLLDFIQKSNGAQSIVNISQLTRSGTAVGAMIREAQGSESRRDFVYKMKLAYKEAEETEYWLILIRKLNPRVEIDELLNKLIQVKKMLSRIIATTIKNMQKPI